MRPRPSTLLPCLCWAGAAGLRAWQDPAAAPGAQPGAEEGAFRPAGGPDLEGLAGLLEGRLLPLRRRGGAGGALAGGDSFRTLSPRARAGKIWEAFRATIVGALSDPAYNLSAGDRFLLRPGLPGDASSVQDDGSVFLSVAAYRDWNCDGTVAEAFSRADRPEKLHVAVVEMNCREEPCWTGTGWGDTRRAIPAKPDEDCYGALRERPTMLPHLAAGRVRVLRLREPQAFGPLFSRFLASKMYTGQSYVLQVDAHSEFRPGWDTSLIRQLRATPSFPRSVISNYPPEPESASSHPFAGGTAHAAPNALCKFSFGDGVVRLEHSARAFSVNSSSDAPRYSMYVAAGFFAAHGSVLADVPFDPLLPFVFSGEEIIMSIRFWTSGWDIYGPTENIVSHQYTRKEAPKYWETIDQEFGPAVFNSIAPLVLQRVRHVMQWPGSERPEPASLLDLADRYGLGAWRPLGEFWENGGVDLARQVHGPATWCEHGTLPKHVLARSGL